MRALPLLFVLLVLSPHALATTLADGERLLARYAEALNRKDADTIAALLAPGTRVSVRWLDASPPKQFTLDAADYVQQLRALWKFSRQDRHRFGRITWQQTGDGQWQATFTHQETRQLQGQESGQDSEVRVLLAPRAEGLRIVHIRTDTRLW